MYKHIFFDLDHTLWDFETNAAQALQELYIHLDLEAKGITPYPLFQQQYLHHNALYWGQYHKQLITAQDLKWQRMAATLQDFRIHDTALAKQMSAKFLELLPIKKEIFPYTKEILNYLLSKQYTLHLITNGFEDTQWRKLKSSGLDTYFTHVITSESTGYIKPQREIYDHAITIAKATADESIMIGDNVDADIKGAANAGWHSIYVNYNNTTAPAEATYTVTQLKELEQIL